MPWSRHFVMDKARASWLIGESNGGSTHFGHLHISYVWHIVLLKSVMCLFLSLVIRFAIMGTKWWVSLFMLWMHASYGFQLKGFQENNKQAWLVGFQCSVWICCWTTSNWENQSGNVRALKIQVKSTYLDHQIHAKIISIEPIFQRISVHLCVLFDRLRSWGFLQLFLLPSSPRRLRSSAGAYGATVGTWGQRRRWPTEMM